MYIYASACEAIASTVFMTWLWAKMQTHKRNGYDRNGYNVLDIKSRLFILEQSNFDSIEHS
jgi:hypothetical protein